MPVTLRPDADWHPLHLPLTSPAPTSANSRNDHYVPTLLTRAWDGLAIFAVFIIVRHTAQSILVWWRRRRTIRPLSATRADTRPAKCHASNHAIPARLDQGTREQYRSLRYLLPPPAPPPYWLKMVGKNRDLYGGIPADRCDPKTTESGSNTPMQDQEEEGNAPSLGTFVTPETTLQRYVMVRPPPPPPLTPPAPPRPLFGPGEHKASGIGGVAALDSSFIHQPNPDYHESTSTAGTSPQDSAVPSEGQTIPYSKSVPISIPAPLQHHDSDPSGSGLTSGGRKMDGNAGFSPSSYPPTSPFLPPAPFNVDRTPSPESSVEVHGEIITATDGYGTGWTRHTKVYGGGTCLACAANGGEGGFYGATAIRPDGRS